MDSAGPISAAAQLPTLRAVRPGSASDATASVASEIAQLTRRLAAGDEAAFREFHAQYFDRLRGFLLAVTQGDEHAARDALQETLLRVVRHVRELADEEIFWCWLKTVARSAARDRGRKQRRYLAVLQRFAARWQAADQPLRRDEENALWLAVDECLAELPPEDRQLVEGKYLRGFTVAELAQQLHATEKATESRLGRLRRQLGERVRQRLRSR